MSVSVSVSASASASAAAFASAAASAFASVSASVRPACPVRLCGLFGLVSCSLVWSRLGSSGPVLLVWFGVVG